MVVSSSWSAQEWMNRGSELLDPDPWLAKRLLARGLQIEPNEAIAWFNLGIGLHQQRRIAAAVRAYRHCLALPHSNETEQAARNNLAQDLLLLGRWQEGWGHYSQRFSRKPGNHPLFERNFGLSHRGPLKRGQPLLVMSEQGLGDTLQFSRYILHLQEQGFDVTLLSQPALVPLLRDAVGLKQVVAQLESEEWEGRQPIWLPLLNVLPALEAHKLWAPFSNGYLQIETELIHEWSLLLNRDPNKRLIALHWQGNPSHEHSLYSRGRSLPFEKLLALGQLSNVEFVSIQKKTGSEQLETNRGLHFVAGQEKVSESMDFKDTAAVLANCDLLISSDSAVVHLAGAMGIPTWLALRWIPEWRWGLEGKHTTWYESVRLFRQPRDGDWHTVIQAMITTWTQEISQ
tara:strand:- start:1068 stop:2270 length:1203 start_codon:yes stop_codon:yes gene_type:complete